MPVKDMTGQKIGKLTVRERDMTKLGGAAYWICDCECGNEVSVRGQSLREYKVDCGCGLSDRIKAAATIDTTSLIGKRFGKLVVRERDMSKPIGHGCTSFWICDCDCGNTTSVGHAQLTSGKTQSCGCLIGESNKERFTKDLTNQRFGMLIAKENTFESTHNGYLWRCECDCGNTEYYCPTSMLTSGKVNSCGCTTRSRGERIIKEILTDNNFKFKEEFKFKNSKISTLRYDFALLDENDNITRLIEFDGEQHFSFKENDKFGGEEAFKIRKEHDIQKNNYAKENNIPLVRIPYTEIDNINLENIMGDKFLV